MSNDLICRTETFNNIRHACFTDDRGDCIVVTREECGLDLNGIPENKQTEELFNAARKTGLSTILSVEDAMEIAKQRVARDFDRDHFRPAMETYERMYQVRLRQYANRFYEDAEGLIQKMRRPAFPGINAPLVRDL